ncbi:MAG: hypothetical protein U5K99_06445 [Anaerolineales bacterium]|nr:hypothetical protein [Anaerolineales bacterium]
MIRGKAFYVLLFGLLLIGCSGCIPQVEEVNQLLITGDGREVIYTVEEMQTLGAARSEFEGETYVGVPLIALLQESGYASGEISTVTAVAADGYSVTYTPEIFQQEDVLVAYAREEGPLDGDQGTFRMVLPGEEGKLNVRLLAELQVR